MHNNTDARHDASPNKNLSRFGGFTYLIVVISGIFSMMVVPSKLMVANDFHASAQNIVAHPGLFLFGIAAFIVQLLAFLILPLLLYKLLSPVNRTAAALMMLFAVVSVPIALIAVSHRLDVLSILTDTKMARAFSPHQVEALAEAALQSFRHGITIAFLFWGLWLLPFGYLVVRSNRLPKILGLFLIVGGIAYVFDVFGGLLISNYAEMSWTHYISLPAAFGEIGTALWLLIVGMSHEERQPV